MTPMKFKSYFRKKFENRPDKYRELKKALEASRLRITLPELLAAALFYPLILMLFVWPLCFLLSGHLFHGIESVRYLGFEVEFWKIRIAISTLISILVFTIARYSILAYPYYLSNFRKGRIDSALPHAVNMMLGMMKGNVPLISAFKYISENKALFGEVSVEFERISVLAEFGDLESAMKYVAETTPSEKLRVFLENLIEVYRGSGNVLNYLKAKSEQFFMEKERSYILFIETLQILAEIYLALFIVAPLFLLIVLTVMNMLGSNTLNLYRVIIFTLIPLGSFIVFLIAQSSALGENRELGKVLREFELFFAPLSKRKAGIRFNKFRKIYGSLKKFLLYPIYEAPYVLGLKHIAIYFLTPGIVFFAAFFGKMEFDYLVFSSMLAIGIPAILFIEYRERLIRRAEKELPDFLKQLASLNEAGLNIVEALRNVGESETSVVSREIKIVKRRAEWGEVIAHAFLRLEERIRSGLFQKAISTLVKAIEASPSIKDALYVASVFSELEVEIRERIRGAMSTYLIVIYLAFAVFLYTTYVLLKNLLSVVSGLNSNLVSVNIYEIESVFMETSVVVAIFSGLAAGIMGEGRIEAGLKHLFVLLVITYVFFKFLI
jgi:flagellar protein FlaJ